MNSEMKNTAISSNTTLREQISRWMDGDIAPHEIDLAMAALSREEGRYCWAEMHFVGDCIRGLENTPGGCAESIRAAIASEPAIIAPAGKRLRVQAQERSLMAAMTAIGRGGRAWATAAAVAAVASLAQLCTKIRLSRRKWPALFQARRSPVLTLRSRQKRAQTSTPTCRRIRKVRTP